MKKVKWLKKEVRYILLGALVSSGWLFVSNMHGVTRAPNNTAHAAPVCQHYNVIVLDVRIERTDAEPIFVIGNTAHDKKNGDIPLQQTWNVGFSNQYNTIAQNGYPGEHLVLSVCDNTPTTLSVDGINAAVQDNLG